MSLEHKNSLIPHGLPLAPVLSVLFIAFWVFLATWLTLPPTAKPLDAPENEFSGLRAKEFVKEFAQYPHPHGSRGNAAVRDYLIAKIKELGYEPVVHVVDLQDRVKEPPYSIEHAENVMVRITGSQSTGAYLHMAHYDSVPYGPGASDDGSGVATMLETLRAIKNDPQPRNDLIFVFTDGEEAGLLGAKAFLTHEWCKDVKLVTNYEARGYYGTALLFQISDQNGWIIEQVAASVPNAIASSVMFDIAGKQPTTTDYKVLKAAGIPGMDVAYIDGFEYYHTENDSAENISPHSLQHDGCYSLGLTRRLGQVDLSEVRAPNKVYFDVMGRFIVHYPGAWNWPLTGFSALLFLGVCALGLRKGFLSIGGMAKGLLAFLTMIIITAIPVGAMTFLGFKLQEEYIVYNTIYYLTGFTALTIFLYAIFYGAALKRIGAFDLAFSTLLVWLVILLVTTHYFPGGTYAGLWTILFHCVAFGLLFALGDKIPAWGRWVLLAGALVPALVLLAPMVYVLTITMTIVPAPAWMVVVILILGLCAPLLSIVLESNGKWLHALSAGAALPLLCAALFWFQFTPETPKLTHMCYGMNCNTQQAFWFSRKSAPLDDWTKQFFPSDDAVGKLDELNPGDDMEYRKASAPYSALPEPLIDVQEDMEKDGKRHLKLKIRSPRHAEKVYVSLAQHTNVYSASINGVALGDGNTEFNQDWGLGYRGFVGDGLELIIETDLDKPLRLTVREIITGLPPTPGVEAPGRLPWMVTENNVMEHVRRNFYGDKAMNSNQLFSVKDFEI